MSLLLLNASNRLSQGFLRLAVESGNYQKIVCADIYPTYTTIERLLKFKATLGNSHTQVDLFRLNDKQDLHDAIKSCNNLLYVSHDYYQLTASKKNLFEATLEYVKTKKYQTVAYVAPVEHDHQQESDEWKHLEVEGRRTIPNLVGIRSDITFGPSSSFTHALAQRIYYGQNIYFKPLGSSPAPIYTGDLEKIVSQVLAGKHNGKSFLAQGHKHIDFKSIIHLLEDSLGSGYKAKFNESAIENFFAPTSVNVFSQQLHCPSYQNLTQLISKYKALENQGYDTLPVDSLVDIDEYYKTNKTIVEQPEDAVSYIVG